MEIPNIPIVLTGAMRSSNELGSDGVYNYLSALRVASHDQAIGKGVLVVMNDEISCKSKRTRGSVVLKKRMSCFVIRPSGPWIGV